MRAEPQLPEQAVPLPPLFEPPMSPEPPQATSRAATRVALVLSRSATQRAGALNAMGSGIADMAVSVQGYGYSRQRRLRLSSDRQSAGGDQRARIRRKRPAAGPYQGNTVNPG